MTRPRKGFPLARCANGCDAPPRPPSLVICGACMDRITRNLERLAGERDGEHEPKPTVKAAEPIAQPKPMSAEREQSLRGTAANFRDLRDCFAEIDRLRADVAAKDAEIARLKASESEYRWRCDECGGAFGDSHWNDEHQLCERCAGEYIS